MGPWEITCFFCHKVVRKITVFSQFSLSEDKHTNPCWCSQLVLVDTKAGSSGREIGELKISVTFQERGLTYLHNRNGSDHGLLFGRKVYLCVCVADFKGANYSKQ